MNVTVMSRLYGHFFSRELPIGARLVLIVVLAFLLHLTVKAIGNISEWFISKSHAQKSRLGFVHRPKFITLIQLAANGVTFIMYFGNPSPFPSPRWRGARATQVAALPEIEMRTRGFGASLAACAGG
jgi:hypothetical protein